MFKEILEYQKLDGKILSIKKEANSNPARQNLNKIVSLIKDFQNKLIELESKAKTAIAEYEKAKSDFESVFSSLEKLSKLDATNLDENELSNNLEQINQLSSLLGNLERNLSFQADNVSNILKNFDVCKNSIVSYRQKYKEAKDACDKLENDLKPQVEELKKQMAQMEKNINPKILEKYKHIRQDKIFPAFVPLNQNACGGCSMSLPAALMEKLKADGYLECEQCRRYIYLEK